MPITLSFYLYSLLFFFLDIILYGLLQKKIIHIVLCIFSIFIFRTSSKNIVIFLMLLLTLEGLLDMYVYGIPLFYLIPITFLAVLTRAVLQHYSTIPLYIALIACLFSHTFFLGYFNTAPRLSYYTFYEIFANMILLFVFLKFLFKGRLGNRF